MSAKLMQNKFYESIYNMRQCNKFKFVVNLIKLVGELVWRRLGLGLYLYIDTPLMRPGLRS
jgi:hypothetical protein